MRSLLSVIIAVGIPAGFTAGADEAAVNANTDSTAFVAGSGNGFPYPDRPPHRPPRPRPPRPPRPPSPPPPHYPPPRPTPGYPYDLCVGTFQGQFSNGVPAVMHIYHQQWNRVSVLIQVGNWNFSGEGTCDQNGAYAQLNYWYRAPDGATDNAWATIQPSGPYVIINGRQGNGLSFSFSR